jgi:glycosyltransferase involved in cell wall biosynthesis
VKLARDFDCVLANTIRSEPAVRSAYKANVPVIWWMHETKVGQHYLQKESKLRSALTLADVILVPTEATARVYRPYTTVPVSRLSNGIPDLTGQSQKSGTNGVHPLQFLVLGSIEPRKGQDLFVRAISLLPSDLQAEAGFKLFGRVMDPEFGNRVCAAASKIKNFSIESEQGHLRALDTLRTMDVLVCSSRDEALPLTILEALSLGKAIISTTVGGIPEALTDGHDALLVSPEDPDALAEAMGRLIRNPDLVRSLGRNGRETFQKSFLLDRFGTEFRELVEKTVAARGGVAQFAGAT